MSFLSSSFRMARTTFFRSCPGFVIMAFLATISRPPMLSCLPSQWPLPKQLFFRFQQLFAAIRVRELSAGHRDLVCDAAVIHDVGGKRMDGVSRNGELRNTDPEARRPCAPSRREAARPGVSYPV